MIRLIDLLKESLYSTDYIGSCVDVGEDDEAEVCRYFPDAATLASYVGNPDEDDWGKSKKLSKDEFFKFIDLKKIPSKVMTGKYTFHYIDTDNYGPEGAAIFFIYNWDQDIHYFFRKNER